MAEPSTHVNEDRYAAYDDLAARPPRGRCSMIRAVRPTSGNVGGYRNQLPSFDASLAYEMIGFVGADAREGLASHLEKWLPRFIATYP